MTLDRREFLKVSAGAAGLLVGPEAQAAGTPVDRWQKAPCRFCGTGLTPRIAR